MVTPFPTKPKETIPMRGRKPKGDQKGTTVLTDFKKNKTVVKSLFINKDRSIAIIKYYDLFNKPMWMVIEIFNGKETIHAKRDGENPAYMVYRRLEKKLTGW
jgi:hypothetical protein